MDVEDFVYEGKYTGGSNDSIKTHRAEMPCMTQTLAKDASSSTCPFGKHQTAFAVHMELQSRIFANHTSQSSIHHCKERRDVAVQLLAGCKRTRLIDCDPYHFAMALNLTAPNDIVQATESSSRERRNQSPRVGLRAFSNPTFPQCSLLKEVTTGFDSP